MIELKRDRAINGERLCPTCRSSLPEQAVVCIHCGLNLITGKQVQARNSRSSHARLLKGFLLLLLIAGASMGAFMQRDRIMAMFNKMRHTQTPPEPPPEPVAELPPPPMEQVFTPPPAEEVTEPDEDLPYRMADLLSTAEGYKESVTVALRRSRPLAKARFTVELCLLTGLVKKGTLLDVTATHVELRARNQAESIPLAMIDPNDRLLIDPRFRSEWIHFRSIAYARNECSQMGLEVPRAHVVGVHPDEAAIELGEPAALLQAARRHLADRADNTDLSCAFLYLGCAALQNDPQAQYQLGRMYFNGVGAARNKQEGLRWISMASGQGHSHATAFLQQQQIDNQAVLLAEEDARRRQEKERQEHAARLEEIRMRVTSSPSSRTVDSGFNEPRPVGRSLAERYPHWTDSRGRTYIIHPDDRVSRVVN